MDRGGPVAIVMAWQDAVNRRDAAGLLALSGRDIELVGPRGSARGRHLLRDWLDRAGLRLDTGRVFARGAVVVVEQRGAWHDAETGALIGTAELASCFHVADGRVARYARYDGLAEALVAGGLGRADEIPAR